MPDEPTRKCAECKRHKRPDQFRPRGTGLATICRRCESKPRWVLTWGCARLNRTVKVAYRERPRGSTARVRCKCGSDHQVELQTRRRREGEGVWSERVRL
jgi:hypothetical protein